MTDTVFDIALEKRFADSAEIATIDVTSADTLLIRDSTTGVIMRLPFSTLSSAISSAFASSFASLVDGKVPASQLPSYVDDVLEYANIGAFPATGESGKIYVSLATNLCYRWSGSTYVEISSSPGSTDVVPEGSTNKYFTDARARSAVSASGSLSYNPSTGIFSFTDAVTSVAGKTGAVSLVQDDISGLKTTDTAATFKTLVLSSSNWNGITIKYAGSQRWVLARDDTETGSNVGSNLYLYRYDDAGSYLGLSLLINRATGQIRLFSLPIYADNAAAVAAGLATDTIYKTSAGDLRIVV